jgi:hypothetical protein
MTSMLPSTKTCCFPARVSHSCLIKTPARWPRCFANPLDMNHLRRFDSDTDNAGQNPREWVDWEIG